MNLNQHEITRESRRGKIASVFASSKARLFGAIFFLILVNFGTFKGYYLRAVVPPWDFVSSASHAQAVAWFEDGSIFRPPSWLPYGSMGFPGWWSIQSGGWYLPLQILSWTGAKYTLFVSAAFQAAHVLVGALGVLFLVRTLGASLAAATLAALTYHFSSTFFSNQQHVEFVRAAALLPWVLQALHPSSLLRNRFSILWACLLIWQFIVASYPGVIVSGGYTIAFIAIWWWRIGAPEVRLIYPRALSVAGVCGVLMAGIKWLTPTILALQGLPAKKPVLSFQPDHLFTFLFRYDLPFLSQDLTMQSLWLPPVALLLLPFARRGSAIMTLGASVFAISLVAGSLETVAPSFRHFIPGFSISRLPHADWRSMLHLGLTIMSAGLIDLAQRECFSLRSLLKRAGTAVTALLIIAGAAVVFGYGLQDFGYEIIVFLLFIFVVTAWLALRLEENSLSLGSRAFLGAVLALILSTSFLQHFVHVTRTWRMPWSNAIEVAVFGKKISDLIQRPRRIGWPRRPARTLYGTDPSTLAGRLDLRLNRAWYAQEFTVFGYDNLGSSEFRRFVSLVSDTRVGKAALAFVLHPGQVVFVAPNDQIDLAFAAACSDEKNSCAQHVDASASVLSYRMGSADYDIQTNQLVKMVENELWYEGWRGNLCDRSGRCQKLLAGASVGGLRTWMIPAGQWRFSTEYVQPLKRTSIVLFSIGLLGLLGFAFVSSRARSHFTERS